MKVLILGAGIIGMATACYLQRRNHHVLILDRENAPGRVSSYMNGGQFSYSYAEPLASPSMLRQLPAMLLDRQSGLKITPAALPEIIPWGLRFLRHCTGDKHRKNTQRVLSLAKLSHEEMVRYVREQTPDFDFRQTGKLHLYRDPLQLQRAVPLVNLKNSLGFGQEIWNPQRCLAAEPALKDYSGPLAGGIFSPLDQSGDSYKLIQVLRDDCLQSGRCEFHFATEVDGFLAKGVEITGIRTAKGAFSADVYVLCAGAESPRLLQTIGMRLPVLPIKGYSITVPALSGAPALNLTDTQHKIVYTRLGDRLRVAGLMEFSGWNRQIDKEPVEYLLRLAKKLLPTAGDYSQLDDHWAGLRPMTPDGTPIIGPTRWRNLWLNTGHGMLGSTLALGSARHIAALLDGGSSPIDAEEFLAERFARLFV
jgi:D-amino-acid dehydrogenase